MFAVVTSCCFLQLSVMAQMVCGRIDQLTHELVPVENLARKQVLQQSRWPTVGLIMNQRLRRWPNIKQTVGESRVFIRTLHILVSWWTRHGNTALSVVGTSQMWDVTTHVIDNRPITSQQAIGFYVMLTVGKHVIYSFSLVLLFVSIFHSFEAGIANAISSFKWRKIFIFMKKNRNHLLSSVFYQKQYYDHFQCHFPFLAYSETVYIGTLQHKG